METKSNDLDLEVPLLSKYEELTLDSLIREIKKPKEGFFEKTKGEISEILKISPFDKLLQTLRENKRLGLYSLLRNADFVYRDTTIGHELVRTDYELAKISLKSKDIFMIPDKYGWHIVHSVAFYHSEMHPELAVKLLESTVARIPVTETGTTVAHIVVDKSQAGATYVLDNYKKFNDIVDNLGISVIHKASHWFDNPKKSRIIICTTR